MTHGINNFLNSLYCDQNNFTRMGSLPQKLTFDSSIIDQSQIDTIDKIISDIVKNLYSLVDDEKITSTKLMILCSIIHKHKRGEIECETDHDTYNTPSTTMTKNICEKKVRIAIQPESALYSIIEESLNEGLFGLSGNKTLEIYTIHNILWKNGEHNLTRLPIVFIESPEAKHILKFLNILQSFSANNESLDVIIGSDHLKQVISGSSVKDFSWKRSYVQRGMDDFVKNVRKYNQ